MTSARENDARPPQRNWGQRAAAYRDETAAWPLFPELAKRLVEMLPRDFEGRALDLASGTGLAAERLLERFPAARVTLVDSAQGMLSVARESLGPRAASYVQSGAERLAVRSGSADAVLCSAAAHLMTLSDALSEVSRCLAPGGCFVFNLWWHALDETAGLDTEPFWKQPVEEALRERGEWPQSWPPRPPRQTLSIADLRGFVDSARLTVSEQITDVDVLPSAFFVDWMAVVPTFLPDHEPEQRLAVIARARELAREQVTIQTTRFCLRA